MRMGFDFQCSDVHLHKFRTIPGLCTVVRVLQPRNFTSLPNRLIWLARELRCLLGQNTAFPPYLSTFGRLKMKMQ